MAYLVTIKENTQLSKELLNEMMADITEDRSEQHPSVTDLIDCLTKTFYNSLPGVSIDFTDQVKMFFLIGLGLESAILTRRKEKAVAGQFDGVFYHVDSIDGGLIEVKSTRSSIKNVEAGFSERWMRQIKSYAKALNLTFLDVAVVYLIPGEFKVYRVEFEPLELQTHWDWMMYRRDVWNKAREENKAPKAFAYNEEWECNGCQYLLLCNMRKDMGE